MVKYNNNLIIYSSTYSFINENNSINMQGTKIILSVKDDQISRIIDYYNKSLSNKTGYKYDILFTYNDINEDELINKIDEKLENCNILFINEKLINKVHNKLNKYNYYGYYVMNYSYLTKDRLSDNLITDIISKDSEMMNILIYDRDFYKRYIINYLMQHKTRLNIKKIINIINLYEGTEYIKYIDDSQLKDKSLQICKDKLLINYPIRFVDDNPRNVLGTKTYQLPAIDLVIRLGINIINFI